MGKSAKAGSKPFGGWVLIGCIVGGLLLALACNSILGISYG